MSRDEVLILLRSILERMELGIDVPIQAVRYAELQALRVILERHQD